MTHNHKSQFTPLFILSAIILAVTVWASSESAWRFKQYLGDINPVLALLTTMLLSVPLIGVLLSHSGFRYVSNRAKTGLKYAFLLAALFTIPVAILDYFVPFPEDINVSFPQSLFFYPVIAYLVEIVCHLLPFTLLYWLLARGQNFTNQSRAFWISLIGISLIEPAFQTWASTEQAPVWKEIYVFLHIMTFNVAGLALFKNFDFVTMYALRIFYYFFWHILWGTWRLSIIFS